MARARKVPAVLVRIDLLRSSKLAALPNDTAMLGYVAALLEAKTQKHMGVFESERHWRLVMGRFARYLPAYLRGGLMERAASLCEDCERRYTALAGQELVVHDYLKEQVDPTHAARQDAYRKRQSGDGESDTASDDESDGNETSISRAHSGSSSKNHQETGERGRGSGGNQPPGFDDDPEGPAVTWLAQHGCYFNSANDKRLRDLITLVEKRGSDRVVAVFEQLASRGMEDGDVGGYVYRASDAFRIRPSVSVADDEDIDRRRLETAERTARLIEERQSVKQPDEAEVRAGMEQLAAAVGRPSRGG